jgi:hypothetical protein
MDLPTSLWLISTALSGMDRSVTQVGAGSGTWIDSSYVSAYASSEVDFIDLHIYPVQAGSRDCLDQALQMALVARSAGKRVLVGESWLFKAGANESVNAAYDATVFARDVFGFWGPADALFLEGLETLAHHAGIDYVTVFWSRTLFAYLDYSPALAAKAALEVMLLENQAAAQALLAGTRSSAGDAYAAISARRDLSREDAP